MKKICIKCKKKFVPNHKDDTMCQKCIRLQDLLKVNKKKVHFFQDSQEMIEENNLSDSYGKLAIQRDFSTSAGKPSVLNNVIKIPVVLAAEMVQWYHMDELPQWLREQYPKDKTFIRIFKPFEELEKAIDIKKLPGVLDHPEGTFLKDLNPYDFEMTKYVKEKEVLGWIKEFWADQKQRSIKGNLYLVISKAPDALLERLMRGDIIDVSIGFGAVFSDGGIYKHPDGWDEEYELKQIDIKLGHLAILMQGEGKCTVDKCGLNHDHKILMEKKENPNLQKDVSVMGHIINFVDSKVQLKFKVNKNDQAITLNKKKNLNLSNTDLEDDSKLNKLGNEKMPKTELELLREKYALLKDENKKVNAQLSQVKATELSTQLTDSQSELKITKSAFEKQKQELTDLKDSFETQKKDLDKFNDEKRKGIIEDIVAFKLKDYSLENIKDESLCNLIKIEKIASGLLNNIADKSLKLGGLPKPGEKEYDADHGGDGDKKEIVSTSFNMNDIRKEIKESNK